MSDDRWEAYAEMCTRREELKEKLAKIEGENRALKTQIGEKSRALKRKKDKQETYKAMQEKFDQLLEMLKAKREEYLSKF